MNDHTLFHRLRKLIGRRCRHLGQRCTVLEVLEDEGVLVLRCEEGPPPIQRDQFDQPLRRAAETLLIQVLDTDGSRLSPDLMDLLSSLPADAA
jgi:hypothetical protein